MKKLILLLFIAGGFFACDSNTVEPTDVQPSLPETAYNYSDLKVPTQDQFSFQELQANSANPKVTDDGATLGRVLFYDNKLSINNKVSCGSCHLQSKAFADNKDFSEGFEGRLTERNSIAIINPNYCQNLFWDSRAGSALDLTLKPVQNHIEMGIEDLDFLAKKLSKVDYYKDLFQKAYGSNEVTPQKLSDAVAQFLCSMTTFDSKFDRGVNSNFSNFTALERKGEQLFNSSELKCASCHSGITFNAELNTSSYSQPDVKGATNIGLDRKSKDKGKEDGKFRIPSLRNVELTGPYMHDGRLKTLEEVIDHYSNKIQYSEHLDIKFKNGNKAVKLNISDDDKAALVAFLKTLTDETYISDPKYSDPFVK